ncbi:MAG: bifunctional nuclease family protein [Planctomycetota bacterium]
MDVRRAAIVGLPLLSIFLACRWIPFRGERPPSPAVAAARARAERVAQPVADPVWMTVRTVILRGETPAVILQREPDRRRILPIFVGIPEALSILQALRRERATRPLTHDLLSETVRNLGGRVDRVVVNELRDRTFFAQIVIQRDGREILLDARPSDSIALALRQGAKILVDPSILKDSGTDLPRSGADGGDVPEPPSVPAGGAGDIPPDAI